MCQAIDRWEGCGELRRAVSRVLVTTELEVRQLVESVVGREGSKPAPVPLRTGRALEPIAPIR